VSILAILIFLVLLALEMPIALALVAVAVGAMLFTGEFFPFEIVHRMFVSLDSFPLLAIPLFILAGEIMNLGGVSKRLADFAHSLVGHLRGGLGHVSVVTGMLFAGLTGSGSADAAAVATLLAPPMLEKGYGRRFTVGVISAAGSIGPIIPPSIGMIVYGVIADVSVAKLFLGGIVPGILIGLSLMVGVHLFAKNVSKTPRPPWKMLLGAFWRAIPVLLVPVIILGGIFTGIFTVTESAGIIVVYATVLSMCFNRDLKVKDAFKILREAGLKTSKVLIIICFAGPMGWLLTIERVPQQVAASFTHLASSPVVLLLMINLLVLILGCFLDALTILVLVTPVFMTVIKAFGIDPVFFGVLFTVGLAIGQITPPVGLVLYVVNSITGTSMVEGSIAVWPWVGLMTLVLILLTFFPQLVMVIPNLIMPIR
jgi:tripartite ATP-independent transporter DctM subunit